MKNNFDRIDIKIEWMLLLFGCLCGSIVVIPTVLIDVIIDNDILEVATFVVMYFVMKILIQPYLVEKSIEIEEKWRNKEKDV